MPVDSCLEDGAFGPEATAAMGEAFDAACEELHIADEAAATRTLIATLILAVARRGELNPVRLRATAAAIFSIKHLRQSLTLPKPPEHPSGGRL